MYNNCGGDKCMFPMLSSTVFHRGFTGLLGSVVWCRGPAVFNQGSRADSLLLVDTDPPLHQEQTAGFTAAHISGADSEYPLWTRPEAC